MANEAFVATWSGAAARSLTLTAFGRDSVVELASAGVLIWRLSSELRHGREISEQADRTASRIAGALLLALAVYVVASAAWSLARQAFSRPGLAVALLAMPAMFWLASRKRSLAERLGSRALRADVAESVGCLWLSLAVVIGLIAQLALGVVVDRRAGLARDRLVSGQGRARGAFRG